ncbi:phage distal tail protein [Paenibacillus sp. FSL R7-0333]|uniref:phage distal tail protein n=1 Tax=Paenibacillus sp. FSL R7-0333 TaxID=1926587 RepID=UPI00096D31A9|nr:hypothetical protein BK146_16725 [Paenibacillus sp. FSL R7-0333]
MFNRGSFNRIAFNREFSVFVFGSAVLRGEGTLKAGANLIATGSVALHGEGNLKASFVREVRFSAAMHGEGGLTAAFVRERLQRAVMHGVGTLKANGSRYHLDEIVFTGSFAPGDRIVIDSKNLTFTKNGQNALHMMQGDFFDLNLGSNNIVYTDPATGREVLIRITYRDKFI